MGVVSQLSVGLEIHYYIALCKSIYTQCSLTFTVYGLDNSLVARTSIRVIHSEIAWSNHENKIWYSEYTPFRVQWSNVDVCEVVEGGRGKVFFI